VVLYGGRGAVVVGEAFGPPDAGISARAIRIRDQWRDFDERAIATANIFGYLWAKEAYGAMLFAIYIALAREILAVALARGVRPESFDGFDYAAYLPDAPPGAASRSLDDLVAHNRKSAKTHSGIWRDLAIRKRVTEVDAQLGIIVRLGAQAGVPTPLTARVVKLIQEIERGVRPLARENLEALAA
jgi:2-dehydropantoate 2-reductase